MFFKIRLPLFEMDAGASGGGIDGGGAGDGVFSTPTPSGPPQPVGTNPLLDDSFGQQPPQPEIPVQPAIEELDFAGRKVPVSDPIIRDLHKDYSELQRTFQETNQTAKQLQEQNQMFQQMFQLFQQQQQMGMQPQQAQPPVPQEPVFTPEDNEQFMNGWYENALGTFNSKVQEVVQREVQKLVESQVNPVIEPIRRERQYSQEIQQLTQRYEDFQQHIPSMQQIIQQNPKLGEQGLETVYWVARGQTNQQQQPTYTPDQMLNDPQFRQQLMSDEKLRNEIVSSYMQQKQQSSQQVPPVMGSQPGGSPPSIPEQRPKSIREASKMFSKYLNG